MDEMVPLIFTWDGEHMVPLNRFVHRANRQYVVGEQYRLIVEEERSSASHKRYFACLREAWKQLPEDTAPRFHDPNTLRKWILIKLGYADEQSIVCETATDAARFAAMLGHINQDSIVIVKGHIVKHFTARSQSVRHMNKAEFLKSSNDVLDYAAGMVGVSTDALAANADQAA